MSNSIKKGMWSNVANLGDRFTSLLKSDEEEKEELRERVRTTEERITAMNERLDRDRRELETKRAKELVKGDAESEIVQLVKERQERNAKRFKRIGYPPETLWDHIKFHSFRWSVAFVLAVAVGLGGLALLGGAVIIYELIVGV